MRNQTFKHPFIQAFLSGLFLIVAWAAWADGNFRPAATIKFANFDTLAARVAAIGQGSRNPLLTTTIPNAIRKQGVAALFGPMRPGTEGIAVCYVDADVVARLMATPATSANAAKREADMEKSKRWAMVYPCSITKQAFLRTHPEARAQGDGTYALIPRNEKVAPRYICYSADGLWVGVSFTRIFAKHALSVAEPLKKVPLGHDIACLRLGAGGAQALFGSDACAGGTVGIRFTKNGLELNGVVKRPAAPGGALPPSALSFAGIPATAPLFGSTSAVGVDIRSADIFALIGPEVAYYVRHSLQYAKATPGVNAYYMPAAPRRAGQAAPQAVAPQARFNAILPEARGRALSNVMFCSPTIVLKSALPAIAKKMPIKDGLKLELGAAMLRAVRGDGLGFMSWREGNTDRFFMRISNDELRGSAILWSACFM